MSSFLQDKLTKLAIIEACLHALTPQSGVWLRERDMLNALKMKLSVEIRKSVNLAELEKDLA